MDITFDDGEGTVGSSAASGEVGSSVGSGEVGSSAGGDGAADLTGAFDLEDRRALGRVAGLSTELTDVTEVEYRQLRLERVVLVSVLGQRDVAEVERSLRELAALAKTAGCTVLDSVWQRRSSPDPATYVGPGKVDEIREIVQATGADTVICDGELTAAQLRTLEDRIKVKVVDRTILILDIFAQHAKSREGKAQIELAQLQYLVQRLRGWGGNLSRSGGGSGGGLRARGPGETKLETDRRRIHTRMAKLRRELEGMTVARQTKRGARRRTSLPCVAIAGYTNAGKSSLLNRLTHAGALVDDALFATLDPTVRRATTPDGREYALIDTVGFIRHLPHNLVAAFASSIEEVVDADLIVHVVDGADEDPEGQITAVREVLTDIGADKVPELIVVNKIDVADPDVVDRLLRAHRPSLAVSVSGDLGIADLEAAIAEALPRPPMTVEALVPYERGDLMNRVYEEGEIVDLAYEVAGTRITVRVAEDLAAALLALG